MVMAVKGLMLWLKVKFVGIVFSQKVFLWPFFLFSSLVRRADAVQER